MSPVRLICTAVWLTTAFAPGVASATDTPPVVATHDNRRAAGQRSGETVTVHLEIREARWFPDDDGGESLVVQAFGEAGGPPQVPGPLLRVPEGTELDVTVSNRLTRPAQVFGLHTRPGNGHEVLPVAAGATGHVRFPAGAPGTYYYWATTTGKPLDERDPEETQLAGAFTVDPRDEPPDDRVFVVGVWIKCTPDQVHCIEVPAINGKSWPFTERFTFTSGDLVRWRWVNASLTDHAMHLHGFYYRVTATGDGERETRLAPAAQPLVVTKALPIGGTFRMEWTPGTPGNWLFHCHMTAHMERHPAVDADPRTAYTSGHIHGFPNDAGMGGLVLGVTVESRADVAAPRPELSRPARRLLLHVRPRPASPRSPAGFSYDLVRDTETPNGELPAIGNPLVLTRNEPVEIEIVNRLAQPTAVHWHGIELESYYDGVPGWTGIGARVTPPIAPGGSFVARFTPPRAGTFIYHTHWHDVEQLTGGLAGALLVLEPGETYDPETDLSFVFTRGDVDERAPASFFINGSPQPAPLMLRAGTTYRLRFVNITPNNVGLRVSLLEKGMPVHWRAVAKDGSQVPAAGTTARPAEQRVAVGETYDFEFTPARPGVLFLHAAIPGDGFVATQVIKVAPAGR
jgi:manganese oxidase